jgi:adenylate cyclase
MSDPETKRRLAAILSADVKGYSRLMADDEASTIKSLTEHRRIISELVSGRGGRVVDSPGDNLLAEFTSAVSAVVCAVEIQAELAARNAQALENRRMDWRIGLNLGDIVAEDDRIYGDGVNIAARIEGLAEPGGICLSQTIYDQVQGKLDLDFKHLGERRVKNVDHPIRIYQVRPGREEASDGPRAKHPARTPGRTRRRPRLRTVIIILAALLMAAGLMRVIGVVVGEWRASRVKPRPVIAVLPFNNLSQDKSQDYLADGLTENIITALSKISSLQVIARNSTFVYKGRSVDIKKVGRALGATHVLEGSVIKAGKRIRVTAQLIDAKTGRHLWAEKYDRPLKDVLALQDEITLKIASALMLKLTAGKQSRSSTTNLKAWGHFVRGLGHFNKYNRGAIDQARRLFLRAVELDPRYALAWVMLAWTHWMDARLGYARDKADSLKKARTLAAKAMSLDPNLSAAHALRGGIHLINRRHDEALKSFKRAVTLQPNDATSLVLYGRALIYAGRPAEAVTYIKRGMRLSPYYPAFYLHQLGHAYFLLGWYKEAMPVFRRFLKRCKKGECSPLVGHLFLAEIYAKLGRRRHARKQLALAKKMNPKLSLDWVRRTMSFKDPAMLEKHLEALRLAGLK